MKILNLLISSVLFVSCIEPETAKEKALRLEALKKDYISTVDSSLKKIDARDDYVDFSFTNTETIFENELPQNQVMKEIEIEVTDFFTDNDKAIIGRSYKKTRERYLITLDSVGNETSEVRSDVELLESYKERDSSTLGSHASGEVVKTLSEIHESCKTMINENILLADIQIVVKVDENSYLTDCYYKRVNDDRGDFRIGLTGLSVNEAE